ncbi:MAG: hypothetical protein ACXWMX_05600 [Candidatus Limnocylindrales bacterium]
MTTWMDRLQADPLPWLLAEDAPVVRHLALRQLLDLPADDPQVVQASQAAMRSEPIAGFLAARTQPVGGPRLGLGMARSTPLPSGL